MIHTIGHSNHPLQRFLALLQQHRITALADVRSTPYSRFNPQFRREPLRQALAGLGVDYIFLGEELGARSADPACYDADGRVSYAKLARTEVFHRGIERLRAAMADHRIAIMCAEREPLECHRTILVARELQRLGIAVKHILGDGTLEEHADAMQRLAVDLQLTERDLFNDAGDVIKQAYELQAMRIAYTNKPTKG